MTIIITLSFAGNETGPFDLYSDATNFATPFAQGISKAALLAGFQVNAPAGTTVVRLDDLSGLCLNTETDIYTCATPNCDFAGEILCNITTTTTTSTPPTTTTTSTPPPAGLCLWSTNGGNPGSVAVYSFDTNTSTEVLVPNDFESTIGINRPICSTSSKLYLLSEKVSTDSYQYVREWNINVSAPGAVPTLNYIREFRIQPGLITYSETTGRVISAIAVTNNILIAAWSEPLPEHNRMSVVTWELPAVGAPIQTLRLTTYLPPGSSQQPARSFSTISLTYGNQSAPNTSRYLSEITSMWMANSGDVMLNLRLDIKPEYNETEFVGNFIKQMKGIPPANSSFDNQYDWSLNSNLSTLINLQDSGVPEFASYVAVKAMPTWGRDGLLQVLQPETLVVYNIAQSLPHTATIETSVNDYNVWLSSANGCANVILPEGFGSCTPTNLPQLTIDGLGAPGQAPLSYLGPQTFQFEGQTVTASSQTWQGIAGYNDAGYNQQELDYINDCGITFTGETIPGDLLTRTVTFGRNSSGSTSLENPAFDYTLSFENPISNLTFKFDKLDSWSNSNGDFFKFDVNNGIPTISIIEGCNVEINAPNEFRPVAGTLQGEASAVISMQSTQPFTTFTLSGTNGGAGGPVWLGCSTPPLDCNLIYPDSSTLTACSGNPGVCYPGFGGFYRIYAWNPISFVRQEIVLPPGSYMSYPNFAVSENYLIADLDNFSFLPGDITRYGYTLGTNGVPENVTWDEIFYTYPTEWAQFTNTMEAISDTKFVALWQNAIESKVLEVEIIEGTTELQITEKWENTDFRLTGDVLLTFKEDGVTPNKLISPSLPFGASMPDTGNLKQFDYLTGALEGTINLPTGIKGTASIGMIGEYIYISTRPDLIIDPSLNNLWRLDVNTSIWSVVPSGQAPVEFTSGGAADFGSRLECRISDGLTKFTEDTTTTTTTPNLSGTKTIWTWFESEINS